MPEGGFDCLGCRETLSEGPLLPSPVRNAHIQLSLHKVDRLIAPSHYLAQRYVEHGIPWEKLTVLPNGVDLERFTAHRMEHAVFTLGFIGYLGAHKGLEFLLRALLLMHEIDKVRLLIVGDGEEADRLRALCQDLSLDGHVTFYGRVENQHIPGIYEQLDVLVVPSIWPENNPVTIIEAMASGIPVIASNIGGIGELVEEGSTGFLVPPRDSAALAERIMRFLAHPELRREMGEKALGKIRRYGIRDQVGHLLNIYEELAEQENPKSALDVDVVLYDSGQSWDLHIREAFHQLAAVEKRLERRLLICHMDLADEETLRSAKFLLIPSPGRDSFRRALEAFQRQMPIVAPRKAWELKELCVASNAGLFYAELEELRECLELFLSNESLRQGMGVKGREFVARYAE